MTKLVIAAGTLSFIGFVALIIATMSYVGYLSYASKIGQLQGCDHCPIVMEQDLKWASMFGIISAIFLSLGGLFWLMRWKPAYFKVHGII